MRTAEGTCAKIETTASTEFVPRSAVAKSPIAACTVTPRSLARRSVFATPAGLKSMLETDRPVLAMKTALRPSPSAKQSTAP